MAARIEVSRQARVPVLVSALTIIEAVHGMTDLARLKWTLSLLRMEPVSQEGSLTAGELLLAAVAARIPDVEENGPVPPPGHPSASEVERPDIAGQYAESSSADTAEAPRRRHTVTAEMVAPAWMHTQISAEEYDSWSEE
ncbi:hypothetical protein [Streptomyces sp. SID14515]|uniref:hypothetical protein n=1 Tax=Streptomyces sp. SID14515 TaxID=2706074 RepID=UPI001EF39F82|nr:hypothetical protein [Streptomyces sp. SID14515]